MTFADFCGHLAKIEATPKRLEITFLLSQLLKRSSADEIGKTVMLALGRLAPLYKDIDFGLAEKMIIRSLASAYNLEAKTVIENFKKAGDLGIVASDLKITRHCEERGDLPRRQAGEAIPTRLPRPTSPGLRGTRSVSNVYQSLLEIATQIGEGSQEKKVNKTADLLRELDPLGAKYAVRIILGNLRLGFSDKTVLDALSVMIAGDKSAREKLEAAYNVRPDIGWLAKQVKLHGFTAVASRLTGFNGAEPRTESHSSTGLHPWLSGAWVKPQLGTPILPALCQRLPSTNEVIKKMDAVAVEPKWDGQRIQAHLSLNPKSKIKNPRPVSAEGGQKSKIAEVNLFTRSLEDVTEMFPDLANGLRALIQYSVFSIQNCILDGEAVAIDPKTGRVLPFQTMITRKRKYGIAEKLAAVPIKYMVFDILYLNGKSLMNEEFTVRRQILERSLLAKPGDSSLNTIIQLAPQLVTSNAAEIRKFLKQQIDSGLEGIIAKRLDAAYIPGRTRFAWVKLKWEGAAKSGGLLDTVDCVVIGTYVGRGKRAGFGVGAFLVGILNTEYRIPNKKYRMGNSEFSIQNSVFVTISKIGTGLTDQQWRELKVKSQKLKVKSQPKEYEVPKELTPDAWLRPELVAEIQADNITKSPLHSAGYALRFPRLVRYRNDKNPDQATTLEEIKKLYQMSLKH